MAFLNPRRPFFKSLLSLDTCPRFLLIWSRIPQVDNVARRFSRPRPDTDILRICSEVVGLKTLSIKFELPRSPFIPPPPTMVYNLNSLITLALEGLPGHVLGIVECMQVPNVDAIKLTYLSGPHGRNDEQNSPDSVNECLRRCTLMTPSLQVLEIHAQHYTTITWKTFLPLRICSHLRRLEVCVQPFTDTDIVDLFGSGEWTSLETLRFTLIGLVYSSSWPSLLGLNTFATYCPNLKTLEICIRIDHSTDLTSLLHYASIPRSCHNLETLEIYGQRGNPFWVGYKDNEIMTAGVVVSRYIDHLFPSLKLLSFGESSCTRKWCEGVADMVKSYQEMRDRHAS
ncbi:hypothetical protein BDZ97DRAFT_858720 [Flammula alnicola]|nr:hypothetical protein BDZ97DRAFT_858720 [Flammula alnicola]